MITVAIVDDEEKSRQTLTQLLAKYYPSARVVAEAGDVEEAFEKISQARPQVVLLDIEMGDGSGFDLLRKFSNHDFGVIFITAFDQYALQAIKTCALDYLLKPVNIEELIRAMDKAVEDYQHKNSSAHIQQLIDNLVNKNTSATKIALPTTAGLEFISMSRIIRCEADGSYTIIYTDDKRKILTTHGLKEYESLLPSAHFFRPHHSHIINLDHIREYQKGEGGCVVMSDGSVVDIAKRRKKDFLEQFGRG